MSERPPDPFDRFDADARRCLGLARARAAVRFGHDALGEPHIALGLLAVRCRARRILEALGCRVEDVRRAIESPLEEEPRKIDKPGLLPLPFTPRARALLELALEQAEKLVGTDSLLLTMLSREWQGRSVVVGVFEEAGVTYGKVLRLAGTRVAEEDPGDSDWEKIRDG